MNIKRSFGASVLFDRRPTSATIALSLAALSAFATLFQGITTILSVSGFYFDFIYSEIQEDTSWKLGLVVTVWAIFELIAILLALQPRQLARLAVISMVGVKLLAFLSIEDTSYPIWQWIVILGFSCAPIILLLSRTCNNYYSLK